MEKMMRKTLLQVEALQRFNEVNVNGTTLFAFHKGHRNPFEELPVQYGGFKRENDFEFYNANGVVSERTLEVIDEICADEVSSSFTID
ncbi:hypothetical protein Q3G72_015581 [Acer saccharum]|nr:hypothetical protein Q3G72_015581 [Acer saccharum]